VDDDVNSSAFADEEEDLMLKEKREEQVRLRQQGLRQKKVEAERKLEEERSVCACILCYYYNIYYRCSYLNER
jgi:hypothetical protein